jgi:hypothetical protein
MDCFALLAMTVDIVSHSRGADRPRAAAIGLRSMLEVFAPTIPDYALDMYTMKGKAMGRGLDHFRSEGAKLVPPPTADDPYEAEAYRLWQIKQQGT